MKNIILLILISLIPASLFSQGIFWTLDENYSPRLIETIKTENEFQIWEIKSSKKKINLKNYDLSEVDLRQGTILASCSKVTNGVWVPAVKEEALRRSGIEIYLHNALLGKRNMVYSYFGNELSHRATGGTISYSKLKEKPLLALKQPAP